MELNFIAFTHIIAGIWPASFYQVTVNNLTMSGQCLYFRIFIRDFPVCHFTQRSLLISYGECNGLWVFIMYGIPLCTYFKNPKTEKRSIKGKGCENENTRGKNFVGRDCLTE